MKTKKVLDIVIDGNHVICIKNFQEKTNPYRVYDVVDKRRRQIAKYGNFDSVLMYIRGYFHILKVEH